MIAQSPAIDTLTSYWNFVFHSQDLPLTLAVFRICFGLVLTYEGIGLVWLGADLFGRQGLAVPDTSPSTKRIADVDRAKILLRWRDSEFWCRTIFIVHVLSCACVTVGFLTRIAAFFIFANFAWRMKRNWYVIQGADNLAKFISLLLVFSNAGARLSVDAWLGQMWSAGTALPASQWPQRLMQIQVSIVYLRTVFWKLKVQNWIDGTAVFHAIYQNPHYRWKRMPRLLFLGPIVACMTWATLLIEFAAGSLIWFRDARYSVMASVVVLQIMIMTCLSLKYFQPIMLVSLVLYVPSEDWGLLCRVLSKHMLP